MLQILFRWPLVGVVIGGTTQQEQLDKVLVTFTLIAGEEDFDL